LRLPYHCFDILDLCPSVIIEFGRKAAEMCLRNLAEVVGSNPTTLSTSFNLVKYGIGMSSFLMSVGQKA
jgi:hypothetical protein